MNSETTKPSQALPSVGLWSPLKEPLFRWVWLGSLFANFSWLILSVGAAWSMTLMSDNASMVAAVQTALMIPMMLFAIPSGSIADVFDKRKVVIIALSFCFVCASSLSLFSYFELITPWVLLGLCFLLGIGIALLLPSWQSSVREQVAPAMLPPAISLNSISFNLARSFGPALGGVIVLILGAMTSYAIVALCYIPMLLVFIFWKRQRKKDNYERENPIQATITGLRFSAHSQPIKSAILRTFLILSAGGSLQALMPLIAKDLLNGNAQTFGFLLGIFGIGAVIGAFIQEKLRRRFSSDQVIIAGVLIVSVMMVLVALSSDLYITLGLLLVSGTCWMLCINTLNVSVQMSSPVWVNARVLSTWTASLAGGMAVGGLFWGFVADYTDVSTALIVAAFALSLTSFVSLKLRLELPQEEELTSGNLGNPEIVLPLSGRNGPITVQAEYHVKSSDTEEFRKIMEIVKHNHSKNGAYGWTLSQDLNDPECWVEHFHCQTWHDYLRHRERLTIDALRAQVKADSFHSGPEKVKRRRFLDSRARVKERSEAVLINAKDIQIP